MRVLSWVGLIFGGYVLISSVILVNLRQSESTAAWIAYIVDDGRHLQNDIFLMQANGSHQRQITNSNAEKSDISWSPTGGWFIYSQRDFILVRDVGETYSTDHLYRHNVNGSNSRQITFGIFNDRDAIVSPDGDTIVMYSNRDGNIGSLFRMDANGQQIEGLIPNNLRGHDALWSPDGAWLYFRFTERGTFRIRPDGSDLQQIITQTMMSSPYTISPDGAFLALLVVETPDFVLRIMPSAGGELEAIASDVWWESNVVWSPDGEWIAFVGFDESSISNHIVLIRPDGSDRYSIARGHPDLAIIGDLVWAGNGDWIHFVGGSGNERDIHRIHPDGHGLQRLTHHRAENIIVSHGPIVDYPLRAGRLRLVCGTVMLLLFSVRLFATQPRYFYRSKDQI